MSRLLLGGSLFWHAPLTIFPYISDVSDAVAALQTEQNH